MVTVAAPPSGLVASSVSASEVQVTWSASSSVSYYLVERKHGSGSYAVVHTGTSRTWPDLGVPAGRGIAYRVRARHLDGSYSDYSNVDVATTMSFVEALTPTFTLIRASHVNELRTAVDALRVTANLGAASWSDHPLQPGVTPIRAVHLTELRTALQQARASLGVGGPVFAIPTIVAGQTLVRASDWNELREGCR